MGLFKKKRISEKTGDDRELISENARSIDALMVLSEKNEELTGKLADFKEKLKYLIASDKDEVYSFDKKIKNHIEDLRIALVKGDGETTAKVEDILVQLKLAVADRNAKL